MKIEINDGFSLYNYLYFIEKRYTIKITIKDFCNFFLKDTELTKAVLPYMFHNCPYCMFIKSDDKLYSKCLSSMEQIQDKLKINKQPYYRVCHAGIGEYIVPIIYNKEAIGCICVGLFREKEEIVDSYIAKVAQKSELRKNLASSHYYHSTQDIDAAPGALMEIFKDVIQFFAMRYKRYKLKDKISVIKAIPTNEDRIILKVLDYINHNFSAALSVDDISKNCYCSESYLNHTFKKRMGVNIKTYINNIRIKHAVIYLQDSDASITDIAFAVGFNDSNYFSKIFSSSMGLSPMEYRKRNKAF